MPDPRAMTAADIAAAGGASGASLIALTARVTASEAAIALLQGGTPSAPVWSVSANPTFPEGNSGNTNLPFTVTRGGSTSQSDTITFHTEAGSANPVDAGDLNGGFVGNTVLTFAPGETTKVVNQSVKGDTTAEPDEKIKGVINNPSRGTIGVANVEVTITNDDTVAPGYRVIWTEVTDTSQGTYATNNPDGILVLSEVVDKNGSGAVIARSGGTAAGSSNANSNAGQQASAAYDGTTATQAYFTGTTAGGRRWIGFDYGLGVRVLPASQDFITWDQNPTGPTGFRTFGVNDPSSMGDTTKGVILATRDAAAGNPYNAGNSYTVNVPLNQTAGSGGAEPGFKSVASIQSVEVQPAVNGFAIHIDATQELEQDAVLEIATAISPAGSDVANFTAFEPIKFGNLDGAFRYVKRIFGHSATVRQAAALPEGGTMRVRVRGQGETEYTSASAVIPKIPVGPTMRFGMNIDPGDLLAADLVSHASGIEIDASGGGESANWTLANYEALANAYGGIPCQQFGVGPDGMYAYTPATGAGIIRREFTFRATYDNHQPGAHTSQGGIYPDGYLHWGSGFNVAVACTDQANGVVGWNGFASPGSGNWFRIRALDVVTKMGIKGGFRGSGTVKVWQGTPNATGSVLKQTIVGQNAAAGSVTCFDGVVRTIAAASAAGGGAWLPFTVDASPDGDDASGSKSIYLEFIGSVQLYHAAYGAPQLVVTQVKKRLPEILPTAYTGTYALTLPTGMTGNVAGQAVNGSGNVNLSQGALGVLRYIAVNVTAGQAIPGGKLNWSLKQPGITSIAHPQAINYVTTHGFGIVRNLEWLDNNFPNSDHVEAADLDFVNARHGSGFMMRMLMDLATRANLKGLELVVPPQWYDDAVQKLFDFANANTPVTCEINLDGVNEGTNFNFGHQGILQRMGKRAGISGPDDSTIGFRQLAAQHKRRADMLRVTFTSTARRSASIGLFSYSLSLLGYGGLAAAVDRFQRSDYAGPVSFATLLGNSTTPNGSRLLDVFAYYGAPTDDATLMPLILRLMMFDLLSSARARMTELNETRAGYRPDIGWGRYEVGRDFSFPGISDSSDANPHPQRALGRTLQGGAVRLMLYTPAFAEAAKQSVVTQLEIYRSIGWDACWLNSGLLGPNYDGSGFYTRYESRTGNWDDYSSPYCQAFQAFKTVHG